MSEVQRIYSLLFKPTFEPTDIDGCVLWLRAGSIAVPQGADVSTWYDESGTNNDIVATNAPTLQTNIINGLPIVRFDGTDDYMTVTLALTQPFTVLLVASHVSGAVAADEIMGGGFTAAPAAAGALSAVNAATDTFSWAADTAVSPGNLDASFHIHGAVVNGAASILRLDGVSSVVDLGANDMAAFALGAGSDGGTPADVDVAEAIAYNVGLSTNELAQLEAYLSNKYAIAI